MKTKLLHVCEWLAKKGITLDSLVVPDTKNEILAKEYGALAFNLQQENDRLRAQLLSLTQAASAYNSQGFFQNEMTKIKLRNANRDLEFHKFMNWLLGGMIVAAFIGFLIF